jgi:hypothetical protein
MVLLALLGSSVGAAAQSTGKLLEFRYTPVARAQVAIWVEDADGNFVATVALTEAVAYRGIGNRPGASQMNSGYRWPYGRREGVLPVWAHRRAGSPDARLFPRVIFQDRIEGYASRSVADQSPDSYYCLSFTQEASSRDHLDAISCATAFNSDKGRYLTDADVEGDYNEPWESMNAGMPSGAPRPLSLGSVYPPRMDVTRCTDEQCHDHLDADRFAADARAVMPEIDAVTRATAPGDMPQRVLFSVPSSWSMGEYVAHLEVNVEGDYNDRWNEVAFPTPLTPEGGWDSYAEEYGYPYRGQPSIVFSVPFTLGEAGPVEFGAELPAGRSSWDHWGSDYGRLEAMSLAGGDLTRISDSDGSGVDRLRRPGDGKRFAVAVREGGAVAEPPGPDAGAADGGVMPEPDAGTSDPDAVDPSIGAVEALVVRTHPDELRSHTWVELNFQAARSERPVFAYDVRVATTPIVDAASFIREGRPAKNATDDVEGATALMLPADTPPGQMIASAIGDLIAQTKYYVAVRATNDLNQHGPIRVAEITTTARTFATVSPCFIATAAYGTPLAAEIGVLRGLRDRYLASTQPGRWLIEAYYRIGPAAAGVIARHESLRSLTRSMLSWVVAAARTFP